MRTRMRTAIKKVDKAIKSGDTGGATGAYQAALPEIDTMVSKGIIHRNKAARHKSRLNKALKASKGATMVASKSTSKGTGKGAIKGK